MAEHPDPAEESPLTPLIKGGTEEEIIEKLSGVLERLSAAIGCATALLAGFIALPQNDIKQEGTYPLPEAQLDRFMFNLRIGYPSEAEELEIALRTTVDREEQPRAVLTREETLAAQALVRRTPVDRETARLATRLVRATRPGEPGCPEAVKRWVRWGAGTRAVQHLILAGKARALLSGRVSISRADLVAVAPDVLRHRLVRSFAAEAENISADQVIQHLLETTLPA